MTDQEYNALRATFPWHERVYQGPKGGIVQIVDKNGMEVPLFTMTKFLMMITAKLTVKPAAPQPAKEAP